MKKRTSLLLAMLLCLSLLLSACAEEVAKPAVNLPITIEAYKEAFGQVLAAVMPGVSLSWIENASEAETVHIAYLNEQIPGVMLLADSENVNVAELALILQGGLDETSIETFLTLSACSGAALLLDEDTDVEAAVAAFSDELNTVFTQLQQGQTPESLYGLPGGVNITALSEGGIVQYFFGLKLNAPAQ